MTGTGSTSVCSSTGCTSPSFAVRVSLCWPWSQEQGQCPGNSTTAFGKLLSITCSRSTQTVSRDQQTHKSISPELLDHADFPDSTLFAIRKNYQLWKIPREGTEQAFRAIRVFLAVMLLFGSLLRARLWSLMTVQQTLPTDQAHMAKEKDVKAETQKLSQQVMLPATGQLAPSRGAATFLPLSPVFFAWLWP